MSLNDGLPATLNKMGMVTSNPILPTPHPCFILVYDFYYFLSFLFFVFFLIFGGFFGLFFLMAMSYI